MKGTYFYSSILATAVPGFLGKKMGITTDFHHWNFITDRLILGALPVLTKWGGSGDHLTALREQLDQRGLELGLVVAALESAELDGFGLNVVEFAKEENWRNTVNPNVEYHHVAFEDTTAKISVEEIALAVEHIHRCLEDPTKAAYVHCKAGKGRSWMIVICYLTVYENMSFEQARDLVANTRKQVRPSTEQIMFASEFPLKFSEWQLKNALKESQETCP